MKKVISFILTLAMMMSLTSVFALDKVRTYNEGQFDDVKATDWYSDAVKGIYEYGLMVGTGTRTFSPLKTITAPEIYLLFARFDSLLNGANGEIKGDDWTTAGKAFLEGHNKAIELQESEDGSVSRAYIIGQLAQIINVSELKQLNNVVSVPDIDKDTPYYAEILQLYKAGVLTGSDAYGTFNPWAYISRAELSAILVRVLDASQRKTFELKETPAAAITGDPTDRDMREMPHVKAVIEKYAPQMETEISGQLMLVTNGTAYKGHCTTAELMVYEADQGYFLKGLDFDINDTAWPPQRELIEALMVDAFGDAIAKKVMGYLDEYALVLSTGYDPEEGITEAASNWVEQHDERTFYFDGMALTWSRYCNDVEIRKVG